MSPALESEKTRATSEPRAVSGGGLLLIQKTSSLVWGSDFLPGLQQGVGRWKSTPASGVHSASAFPDGSTDGGGTWSHGVESLGSLTMLDMLPPNYSEMPHL